MAGRKKNEMNPTVIITCGDALTKRKVGKTCKGQECRWLRHLLKENNIALITVATNPLALSAKSAPSEDIGTAMNAAYSTYSLQHLPSYVTTSCGAKIFLRDGNKRPWRYCTLGGLLLVNGQVMGMTAGHPFLMNGGWPTSLNEENADDDTSSTASSETFVFNMGTDETDRTDVPTKSSPTSWNQAREHISQTFLSQNWRCEENVIHTQPTADNIGTDTDTYTSLDWALLKALPASIIERPNQTCSGAAIEELALGSVYGAVSISLADVGPQSGYLHPSTVTIKVERWILEAQLITLDSVLRMCLISPLNCLKTDKHVFVAAGCSGAWVILEGKLCGCIVMARTDVPWAYMVPIGPIMDNIRTMLQTDNVRLPKAGELESLRPPTRQLYTLGIETRSLTLGTQPHLETEYSKASQGPLAATTGSSAAEEEVRNPTLQKHKGLVLSSTNKGTAHEAIQKPGSDMPQAHRQGHTGSEIINTVAISLPPRLSPSSTSRLSTSTRPTKYFSKDEGIRVDDSGTNASDPKRSSSNTMDHGVQHVNSHDVDKGKAASDEKPESAERDIDEEVSQAWREKNLLSLGTCFGNLQ